MRDVAQTIDGVQMSAEAPRHGSVKDLAVRFAAENSPVMARG